MLCTLLSTLIAASPISTWMQTPYPAADGFDYPLGDADGRGAYTAPDGRRHVGFRVSTTFNERYSLGLHPGEDWNGKGGGNSDLGLPVHSVAAGRVVFAGLVPGPWGKVVMVEHTYFENHRRRVIQSSYAHLDRIDVAVGQVLKRRARIGTVGQDPDRKYSAHLHLELRSDLELVPNYWPSSHDRSAHWIRKHYLPPSEFIAEHRALFVPAKEATLVVVHQGSHALQVFQRGRSVWRTEVGFGQEPGRKRRQGDLKTPRGMYFVTAKSKGPFTGKYGAYYGGHWIKVNYPNAWDAEYGVSQGWLKEAAAQRIRRRWKQRKLTSQKTPLGGGIGFHGWAGPWSWQDTGWLSWGCVVLHNEDVGRLYNYVQPGAMVVLL